MAFSLSAFKAAVEEQNVMHGNRYIFSLTTTPQILFDEVKKSQSDIQTFSSTAAFRAENVQVPGMSFSTADGIPPRFGYGAIEGIPYGILHEDLVVTFGLDDKGIIHKLFYDWSELIVGHKAYGQSLDSLQRGSGGNPTQVDRGYNKGAYEVEYKDAYYADIDIYVLGPEHEDRNYLKDHVLHMKFFRAYPRNVPALNLSYAEKNNYLRFPVTFNYTDMVINHKKLNTTNTVTNRR